jgi:sterol desaturase/sphingolipid hydroxylase (fatty acid hydroxylase superfamily)
VFQARERLPGEGEIAMENIIGIVIPVSFIVALVVERLFAAQHLPKVRGWLWKGLAFFAFTGLVNAVVPALVAKVVGDRAPLHLSRLGVLASAIAGFLVADFVGYWLHRTMHRVPFIWRWTHQMHHSAERMDLAGISYSHPFDTILVFALTGLATALLGLSPAAAALAGFLGYATAVIQHSNIRTPRVLGYFLQRPEQHGLHHQRGVHAYNYGSFMLWDLLFGTFRNPAAFPAEYGFWDGASARMGALLAGRDVSQP